MDESITVKIQYFHDALVTQIDNIDNMLISNYKMTADEISKMYARKSALKGMLERYENLFENVLYIEK
jgi:hypothetical protein